MNMLALFIYLQLLDFLTTLLFLKMGVKEGNWIVEAIMRWDPIVGLLLAKLVTIIIALLALRLHKERVMRWANLGYGGIVAWNLFVMIST